MARSMNVARRTGTTVPRIQGVIPAVGQTFKPYAVVVTDVNGDIVECTSGAGALSVLGLALQGAFTGPGYNVSDSDRTNTLVQGADGAVSVAIADHEQEFSARGVNGGTDPVTPAQTNIDEQYGLLKTAGGDWVIDISNVIDLAIQITDVDIENKIFFFKFLPAVMIRP